MTMKQNWNAYANEQVAFSPTGNGLLNGKTFAIKDVFAIKGHTSGAGNPDWLRTHKPAARHAAVVEQLLNDGASLEGTTITDELMYSINGENVHYGTPVNPNAAGRIPGGSSSGSAVAVAAGLADFAIGTDTGGSIRVPAAYCGIYGIRPTHGAVDENGLIPLAASFDTVGWLARDAHTLHSVGQVLLKEQADAGKGFSRMLLGLDLWDIADESSKQVLSSFLPHLHTFTSEQDEIIVAPEGLREWMQAFRVIQGIDIWSEHQEWVTQEKPSFGPGIADRFAWASTLKREDAGDAYAKQEQVQARMEELLKDGTVLVIPTVPAIAPLLNQSGAEVEQRRIETFELCCVAGLAGLPQVTVPFMGEQGCPIGLSFIAGRNQDLRLLEWVASTVEGLMKSWSREDV